MLSTTQPLRTAALKRTCKQVTLPSLAAKPALFRRPLAIKFGMMPAKEKAVKPVTLVIGINHVDATPSTNDTPRSVSMHVPLATVTGAETQPKRQRKLRKASTSIAPLPLLERKWITVKEAAAVYPKSEQAFRHLIHQSARQVRYPDASLPSFGFEKCVVRQPGSRNVYLVVEELDRWMAQGQGAVQ